jgi:transcriptional antiterminator RfaH
MLNAFIDNDAPHLAPLAWYLIRTKSNRERFVREQLSRLVPEVFLPMLKLPVSRRTSPSLVPLFPQYLFARCDLAAQYFEIRYMRGVAGFVSTGMRPVPLSEQIVESVRSRCINGVVELGAKRFRQGECVRVVDGPFRDFEAIFEGYLSGSRRVAILIQTVEGRGVRVVADASIISR